MSDPLTAFLRARIEEQQVAATLREVHNEECEHVPQIGSDYTYPCDCGVPEWMLRDAEAKRAVVDLADGDTEITGWLILRSLANAYTDHPDYREAWRL